MEIEEKGWNVEMRNKTANDTKQTFFKSEKKIDNNNTNRTAGLDTLQSICSVIYTNMNSNNLSDTLNATLSKMYGICSDHSTQRKLLN